MSDQMALRVPGTTTAIHASPCPDGTVTVEVRQWAGVERGMLLVALYERLTVDEAGDVIEAELEGDGMARLSAAPLPLIERVVGLS